MNKRYFIHIPIGFARLREKQRKNKKERGVELGDDIETPAWINRVTLAFFWTKVACTVGAYVGILHFLLKAAW